MGRLCMIITYSKSKDQPGKVANPARGQLNREVDTSLSHFAPENLISRDGIGSPVLRQRAHIFTPAGCAAYIRDSSRFPRRRPFIYLNHHTPSGQSRVHRVTRVRWYRARKPHGSSKRVLPWQITIWTNEHAPLFPTPTIGMK